MRAVEEEEEAILRGKKKVLVETSLHSSRLTSASVFFENADEHACDGADSACTKDAVCGWREFHSGLDVSGLGWYSFSTDQADVVLASSPGDYQRPMFDALTTSLHDQCVESRMPRTKLTRMMFHKTVSVYPYLHLLVSPQGPVCTFASDGTVLYKGVPVREMDALGHTDVPPGQSAARISSNDDGFPAPRHGRGTSR